MRWREKMLRRRQWILKRVKADVVESWAKKAQIKIVGLFQFPPRSSVFLLLLQLLYIFGLQFTEAFKTIYWAFR